MGIAKNISSSNGAVSLPSLLIITTVLLSAMENPGAEAYYTQQFYLPMGYFRNHLFERPSQVPSRPQQQLPIQKPFYVDSIADEPKVIVLEEQLDAEEGGDVGKQTKKQPFIRNSVEMLQQRASGEQQPIPRRQMRHLLADEFSNGRMGRQYKRMRPCFYSPIQCLMRKRSA